MDERQPNPQPVEQIDPAYRGYVTNRLFSVNLPPLASDLYAAAMEKYELRSTESLGGELEYLGLDPADLKGRILSVGIGGARSVLQAVENGFDMYGVDLALKAQEGKIHPGARTQLREELARESLNRAIQMYPGRIREADAARRIPFPDNFFDTTIACVSLPSYARNPAEAANSILEMIRVSQDRVAFTTSFRSVPNAGQLMEIGVGKNTTQFDLLGLLKDLQSRGISFSWKVVPNKSDFDPFDIVSVHLDLSGKKLTR